MACSIEETQTWDSVQTQTDQINDDEIRRVVDNIRQDLNQLGPNNAYLCNGLKSRSSKLSMMGDYHTSMSATMSEFSGTMSKLWEKIQEYRSEGYQLDHEIHGLQEEKDILDEEESSLVNQSAAKIGTEEDSLKETDLTEEEKTELQLNDYVRCDLYRKLRCLQDLKDTSQKLKTTYQQEWSEIKEDIKKNRKEVRHYERELQNLQNKALLKMRSMCLNPDNKQDKDILELITYLEMKREMRELNQNTLDLQVMSRDFEYSVTQLLDTRKELIEENYALDPEDQDEPGVKLHRTSRHTNLRVNYDQLDDSDDEESVNAGEVYSHIGGTHLHRCSKHSCIAIPIEMWNAEELDELRRLTPIVDSEETSDESDVSDDVSISDVKIEFLDDQQQELDSKQGTISTCITGTDITEKPTIESKEGAISKNIAGKPAIYSDLPDKQMDEIASGGSGGLLTKLRARMGIQAHSGTSLRPMEKSEAGPRRFSLKDSAKAFITNRQKRK